MEQRYQTLRTLYEIAKNDSNPTTYLCRPREIILRLFLDWSIIQEHLRSLEEEGLVVTRKFVDTIGVSITAAGIEKTVALNSLLKK